MNENTLKIQNRAASAEAANEQTWTAPFIVVCLFVFFEYAGPQHTLTFLQPARPLLVLILLLSVILLVQFPTGVVNFKDSRTKLVLAFWVLMGLHILLAFNNFMAYGLTRAMFPYVVLFLGIVTYTRNSSQLRALIILWLVLSTYQALYGMTHSGHGVGAYFGDENDLSVALSMAIPVAYFLFLSRDNRRLLYAICLGVLSLGLVFTFSRGGFLGLVAVVLYILWKSPRRTLAFSIIAVLAVLVIFAAPPGYWNEMNTIADGTREGTAEHRIYLWKAAWRMFLDNALWGVGPGSFSYAVPLYEPPGGFYGQYQGMRALHSTLFTLISEMGLPGIIVFTMIVLRHFRSVGSIVKDNTADSPEARFFKYSAIGLAGGLIGFLVSGAFVSMLYYPQFWILTGIFVALHRVWNREFAGRRPS